MGLPRLGRQAGPTTGAEPKSDEGRHGEATTAPQSRLGLMVWWTAPAPRLMPMTPTEFGALMADETEKWAKVVKFAGIKPD